MGAVCATTPPVGLSDRTHGCQNLHQTPSVPRRALGLHVPAWSPPTRSVHVGPVVQHHQELLYLLRQLLASLKQGGDKAVAPPHPLPALK